MLGAKISIRFSLKPSTKLWGQGGREGEPRYEGRTWEAPAQHKKPENKTGKR